MFARHGVAGGISRALAMARRIVYLAETHIWYALDIDAGMVGRALPEGLELVSGSVDDLHSLDELGLDAAEAADRLRRSAQLWLVRDANSVAFVCWIFFEQTPVLAAPSGWLDLPAGVVCLEDSFTAAAYRGRGIAPAAWSAIAEILRTQRILSIITKVGEANAPSRRAVLKAGFREVAVMRLRRVGPYSKIGLAAQADEELATVLASRLQT